MSKEKDIQTEIHPIEYLCVHGFAVNKPCVGCETAGLHDTAARIRGVLHESLPTGLDEVEALANDVVAEITSLPTSAPSDAAPAETSAPLSPLAVFHDGSLIVLIEGLPRVYHIPAVLDWYAKEYAIERKGLWARPADSVKYEHPASPESPSNAAPATEEGGEVPSCPAKSPNGFECDLRAGHEGMHVAEGYEDDDYEQWADTPLASPSELPKAGESPAGGEACECGHDKTFHYYNWGFCVLKGCGCKDFKAAVTQTPPASGVPAGEGVQS